MPATAIMQIELTAGLSRATPRIARTVALLACLLALAKQQTTPASKRVDVNSKLLQKTDDKGRHYNARGQYLGKTSNDDKHYDTKGKYTGKTVATSIHTGANTASKSYNARGELLQSTDSNGRITDAQGKYQGKIKARSLQKPERATPYASSSAPPQPTVMTHLSDKPANSIGDRVALNLNALTAAAL